MAVGVAGKAIGDGEEDNVQTDADKAEDIDLCYLCERPGSPLDAELCVTQLTVVGVGR